MKNNKSIFKMKNYKTKFEDFENKELSKTQQKTIRGGDDTDPTNRDGKGATL